MHPGLLLLPLASFLHVATATTNDTSSTTCTSARCAKMTIKYPFLLGGVRSLYCGYCDGERAYFSRMLREHMFHVHDISYENNTLVMSVESTFAGNNSCPFPDFNVSSSLALFPVNISTTNKELVFVFNCTIPQHYKPYPQSCGLQKMEAFITDQRVDETPVLGNCSYLSVPVRGGAEAGAYKTLINGGFLLEWEELGDCRACNHSGGRWGVQVRERFVPVPLAQWIVVLFSR